MVYLEQDNLRKNLYAVGGNPEAAAVSGISVFAVTMGAFVLAGILYGFGSWLECNRMIGSGSAAYGQGWDMDAIAACVVGGVSFTGGIGKISGVVTGVMILRHLPTHLLFWVLILTCSLYSRVLSFWLQLHLTVLSMSRKVEKTVI